MSDIRQDFEHIKSVHLQPVEPLKPSVPTQDTGMSKIKEMRENIETIKKELISFSTTYSGKTKEMQREYLQKIAYTHKSEEDLVKAIGLMATCSVGALALSKGTVPIDVMNKGTETTEGLSTDDNPNNDTRGPFGSILKIAKNILLNDETWNDGLGGDEALNSLYYITLGALGFHVGPNNKGFGKDAVLAIDDLIKIYNQEDMEKVPENLEDLINTLRESEHEIDDMRKLIQECDLLKQKFETLCYIKQKNDNFDVSKDLQHILETVVAFSLVAGGPVGAGIALSASITKTVLATANLHWDNQITRKTDEYNQQVLNELKKNFTGDEIVNALLAANELSNETAEVKAILCCRPPRHVDTRDYFPEIPTPNIMTYLPTMKSLSVNQGERSSELPITTNSSNDTLDESQTVSTLSSYREYMKLKRELPQVTKEKINKAIKQFDNQNILNWTDRFVIYKSLNVKPKEGDITDKEIANFVKFRLDIVTNTGTELEYIGIQKGTSQRAVNDLIKQLRLYEEEYPDGNKLSNKSPSKALAPINNRLTLNQSLTDFQKKRKLASSNKTHYVTRTIEKRTSEHSKKAKSNKNDYNFTLQIPAEAIAYCEEKLDKSFRLQIKGLTSDIEGLASDIEALKSNAPLIESKSKELETKKKELTEKQVKLEKTQDEYNTSPSEDFYLALERYYLENRRSSELAEGKKPPTLLNTEYAKWANENNIPPNMVKDLLIDNANSNFEKELEGYFNKKDIKRMISDKEFFPPLEETTFKDKAMDHFKDSIFGVKTQEQIDLEFYEKIIGHRINFLKSNQVKNRKEIRDLIKLQGNIKKCKKMIKNPRYESFKKKLKTTIRNNRYIQLVDARRQTLNDILGKVDEGIKEKQEDKGGKMGLSTSKRLELVAKEKIKKEQEKQKKYLETIADKILNA